MSNIKSYFCKTNFFNFRTAQEEIRRSHNQTTQLKIDLNNTSNDTLEITDDEQQQSHPYSFSTQFCIITHGTIVTLLFLFAISRYSIIIIYLLVQNLEKIKYIFLGRSAFSRFVHVLLINYIIQCSTELFQRRCVFSIRIHLVEY